MTGGPVSRSRFDGGEPSAPLDAAVLAGDGFVAPFGGFTDDRDTRLARDLHDGLGQRLAGIKLMSERLARKLGQADVPEAAEASLISQLVGQTIATLRGVVHGLTPVATDGDGDGLVHRLWRMAEAVGRIHQVDCRLDISAIPAIENRDAADHVYFIAQEAVHNALKHGEARQIEIRLGEEQGGLRLMVESDGRPFREPTEGGGGRGLCFMAQRAQEIGGRLEVTRGDQDGARVTCLLPDTSVRVRGEQA